MGVSLRRIPALRRLSVSASDSLASPVFGIGLGMLAYALFSVHDATIKWLVATLPTWEVLFFRSLTISIACLVIGRRPLLERTLPPR